MKDWLFDHRQRNKVITESGTMSGLFPKQYRGIVGVGTLTIAFEPLPIEIESHVKSNF